MARYTAAGVMDGSLEASRARPLRLAVAACFGVPAVVLAGSWLWLVLEHGTLRLWNVIVHESGTYTLGETIFYHAHFVREIPVAAAYALFALAAAPVTPGAAVLRIRPATPRGVGTPARSTGWLLFVAAGALVTWALVSAASAHGWETVISDLLQFRMRDDIVAYGSHWRYHLLSTAWFGAALPLAVALVHGRSVSRPARGVRTMQVFAWGWVLLLTLVFGISVRIFTDVQYAGHQAREIMTHGPVTMLLAAGLVVLLSGGQGRYPTAGETESRGGTRLRVAATLLIPAWLAAVALTGNVIAAGQTGSGLAGMIAAHYFEHTLDYILVVLLVTGVLWLRMGQRETAGERRVRGGTASSGSRA